MKKYGIFYGSLTGTTADVANRIANALGVPATDVHDVKNTAPSVLGDYDEIILGTSTWGDGEIESDWYDFLDGAKSLDLKGKRMAVFGCGDETMSETFCNGVGELYKAMLPTGVTPVGDFDVKGYTFDKSDALVDGKYVGLLLDEVNHPELTDARIKAWTAQIALPVAKAAATV